MRFVLQTSPRCSKHKQAHADRNTDEARGRRGGGGGGRGRGGGRRSSSRGGRQSGAVRAVRRAASDRVFSKLRAELKLQNQTIDDNDFDAEADFHEDVLDAAESDDEDLVANVAGQLDSDDDAAAAPSPDATPPQSDSDELPDDEAVQPVSGPIQCFGAAGEVAAAMTHGARTCLRHWTITMAAILRAFTDSVNDPRTEQPKCVSLVQRNDLVVWFAWESALQPSTLEGRVIQLDERCRVQYRHPGPNRKYVINLTPELVAGTARVLLHTRSEHVQARLAERHEVSMSNVLISRCWHMLAKPSIIVCAGCKTPSPMCALCQSALSSCCLSIDAIHTLDVMSALHLEPAVAQCKVMSTSTQTLLWELRTRRAEVLCLLCNEWLSRRDDLSS